MIDKKIEEIARQMHSAIPQGIHIFREDMEKKISHLLQSQLSSFNLINREMFDAQTQILLRTRKYLTLLEERITRLENILNAKSKENQKEE